MSPRNLKASVGDIRALISCSDKLASSAPGSGSRAAIGEDLAATTKVRLEARALTSQDNRAVKKRRRFVESYPLNVISSQGMVANTCSQSYDTLDARPYTLAHVKSPQIKVCKCVGYPLILKCRESPSGAVESRIMKFSCHNFRCSPFNVSLIEISLLF